jgi:hypothetical protein
MIDIQNIGIKILILYIFMYFVDNYPKMKIYSSDTKFNMYRSLLCIFFSSYALENSINQFNLISNPFHGKSIYFDDIIEWFNAYLILDLYKMIKIKNTRYDLYLHHIIVFVIVNITIYSDTMGFIGNTLLINEIISIVSGIDSIYIEENQLDKSKHCKVIRKYLIKYIRIPLWILVILITLYYRDNISNKLLYIYIMFLFSSIALDNYWLYKCNKVINK